MPDPIQADVGADQFNALMDMLGQMNQNDRETLCQSPEQAHLVESFYFVVMEAQELSENVHLVTRSL